MSKTTKILWIIIIMLLAFMIGLSSCTAQDEIEVEHDNYKIWVTDKEDLFSDQEEAKLNSLLSKYEKLTTIEIAVLTTNTYESEANASDYATWVGDIVKGYATHEKETFTAVVEARAKATQTKIDVGNMTPESMAAFQQSQQGLSGALGKLMMITENYPELKANEQFLNLQVTLEKAENRIAVERRKFNETAKNYNESIRKFPDNMLAGPFGFDKKPYFESQAGSDVAPEVKF